MMFAYCAARSFISNAVPSSQKKVVEEVKAAPLSVHSQASTRQEKIKGKEKDLQGIKEYASDSSSSGSNSSPSPSSKKFKTNTKQLPSNFAENVLELEMELERDCSSIENINKLLYLYSVSIITIMIISIIVSCRILQRYKQ